MEMWQQNQYEANFIAPTIFKVLEEEISFSKLSSFSHNFQTLSLMVTGCLVCPLFYYLVPTNPLTLHLTHMYEVALPKICC